MAAHRYHHNHYHELHFIILLLLMSTSFFAFVNLSGEPAKQLQVGVITSLTYALWGVFHHLFDRNLNWKVVVEYAGIAALGSTLVWFLLFFA